MASLRWTVEIPAASAFPPVVAGGYVVVATLSGQLLARRAGDGTEVWVRDLLATGPPAADHELIVVPGEGAVHALSLASGESLWTIESPALTAPPLVGGGWVIVASGTRLTAFSAAGGDVVWSIELALIERRPAFHGGLLLVSLADGRIVGLALETGSVLWESRVGANPSEPFAYGDHVYVGSDGVLFTCLRADNGSEAWTQKIGASLRGTATADPERIYIASTDNLLRAFRRSTGAVDWKQDLGYRPLSGPVLLGAAIAVAGRDKAVKMYSPAGRAAATLTLPASPVTAPGIGRPSENPTGPVATALAFITGDPGEPWRLSLTGPPQPAMPAPTPLKALPGETLPPMSLPVR